MTNLAALDGCSATDTYSRCAPTGGPQEPARLLRLYLSTYRCDYVLLNTPPSDLFVLALLKYVLPLNRCRLVSMDCVLPYPSRDAACQGRAQGPDVPEGRPVHRVLPRHPWVPAVLRDEADDSCTCRSRSTATNGSSPRRSATRATSSAAGTRAGLRTLSRRPRLEHPVQVVTREDAFITQHGTQFDERGVRTTSRSSATTERLVPRLHCRRRLVALPIRKRNISASGIGVYLASMALGKCVIISEASACQTFSWTAGVLGAPEDPASLREAIHVLYEDGQLRSSSRGRLRIRPRLQGEQRLPSRPSMSSSRTSSAGAPARRGRFATRVAVAIGWGARRVALTWRPAIVPPGDLRRRNEQQ